MPCVVAFDDVFVRGWARYALGAAGLSSHAVADRADLFVALADGPPLLVIGARFDDAPVASLLASIRAAGSDVVAVVVNLAARLDSRALTAAARRARWR